MERATSTMTSRLGSAAGGILIVFVDGVGLGPNAPGNPFADRSFDGLRALAGGPLVTGGGRVAPGLVFAEVDATLGVEGLPQSGTGQTTLFTGVNAARAIGRHVPALPGPRLKAIIEAEGLFAKACAAGHRVAFANAFAPGYLQGLSTGERRASVTVHLAQCAGVPLLSEAELLRGEAVTWELERDLYRRVVGEHVPPITAATAGLHLARIAPRYDLTLYETFLTDLAGHGRVPVSVLEAIERVDAFVGGLVRTLPERVTLVLCSDHGNVEEPQHGRHTRNPVPLVARGPLADRFAGLRSIEELTPAVLRALGAGRAEEAPAPQGGGRRQAAPLRPDDATALAGGGRRQAAPLLPEPETAAPAAGRRQAPLGPGHAVAGGARTAIAVGASRNA